MTSSRDPGAARGTANYPTHRPPCATCSHSEGSHRFKATNVERAECSVSTHLGACFCKAFEPSTEERVTPLDRVRAALAKRRAECADCTWIRIADIEEALEKVDDPPAVNRG